MKYPIIRVFYHGAPYYVGPHFTIPSVGEHIYVQYRAHKVDRVDHILGLGDNSPCCDIYLEEEK